MKEKPIQIRNRASLKNRRKELRKNQTEYEKIFWQKLRNRQLNNLKFFRQYSFGAYILDFYCPEIRLAIELDGGQHLNEENQVYDKERTLYLEANRVRVLRFWNHEPCVVALTTHKKKRLQSSTPFGTRSLKPLPINRYKSTTYLCWQRSRSHKALKPA